MITDDLKFVLPIKDNIHAYHTPISEEVFRANFKVLAAANSALCSKGIQYTASVGPRIATLTILDEGRQEAARRQEEGDMGAQALLDEIKRLTVILVPSEKGWNVVPVDQAIGKHITKEEWEEAENVIVFFTCLYSLTPPRNRKEAAEAICGVIEATPTRSAPTEWKGSTTTSTKGASTAATSSVPV